ncbi:Ser/Thr protein phosphatase [Pseudomonas syringae pv. maculicola]|uniref:metallophosphoesterase n=1 Tax=Pseudomonas syringae group genomosp. 3 TaxID=251701 RepID=UPI000EFE6C8A|nr:metallophosphoesterase [Pseudomonas syringae group genomosp. 3]RMO81777.1 Ser/Thr protein phosphatase [Pseudomonas syringae pv. maculicola]
MRLYVVSDLHNEFDLFDPPALDPHVDLVILGGDIDKKARGVKWANETFSCNVAYVCGNHEFYDGHIDRTLQKMRDAAAPHVHVLDNQSLIIGNIRILGSTSWTDFTSTGDQVAASRMAWERMNDFNYIRIEPGYRRLRPADLITRNHIAKNWLTEELGKPFNGKTFVVTHHSPSSAVVGSKHEGHLNAAYTNDWPQLIQQADLWVFGHTHESIDVELGGCRIVSNPRGYPGESTGFDPFFEIEIEI